MSVPTHRHRAYAYIRHKMLVGEVKVGSHLSEAALANEIGVSRTPVREAMNRLGTEGLLERAPNRGTFIKKFSREEVWEMLELREVLEGYAAARAATRMGPAQLGELQRLCDRMRQMCRVLRDEKRSDFSPSERKQFTLTDASFHLRVIRSCGNRRVARLVDDLGIITSLCTHTWVIPDEICFKNYCWTWAAHLRVARALAKHDGEAAQHWARDHVRRGKETLMKYYDDQEESALGRLVGHSAISSDFLTDYEDLR